MSFHLQQKFILTSQVSCCLKWVQNIFYEIYSLYLNTGYVQYFVLILWVAEINSHPDFKWYGFQLGSEIQRPDDSKSRSMTTICQKIQTKIYGFWILRFSNDGDLARPFKNQTKWKYKGQSYQSCSEGFHRTLWAF